LICAIHSLGSKGVDRFKDEVNGTPCAKLRGNEHAGAAAVFFLVDPPSGKMRNL
jgi:hypothetical protein